MKKVIVLITAFLVTSTAIFGQEKAGKKDTSRHTVFYTCPMHPDVKSDKAGKCPTCGMDLNLSTKEQMKLKVTRAYACPIHADMTSNEAGKCPACGRKMSLSPKEKMKMETVKLYTCPMHPGVTSDKEGKCPQCGMTLTETKKEISSNH